MRRKMMLALALGVCQPALAQAAVITKDVTYQHDGMTFKGFLAWDDKIQGKRPGVLVVHEFWGLNDYAKKRAQQLAELGYVAFACDMYGEGKVTEHPKEAAKMAGEVRKDVKAWRGRALAALKILQEHELVDKSKLASIGYCFGGSTSLQLAYAGADIAAVVSFHGALPEIDADQAKNIKAKILICHGSLDSFIPEEAIKKTRSALDEAKADYQMTYYAGAYHSFTVPGADEKGLKGIAYNESADRRSWAQMRMLFREVFEAKK